MREAASAAEAGRNCAIETSDFEPGSRSLFIQCAREVAGHWPRAGGGDAECEQTNRLALIASNPVTLRLYPEQLSLRVIRVVLPVSLTGPLHLASLPYCCVAANRRCVPEH